jgi:hypothetical protein
VAVAGPVAWLLAFALFWRFLPPVGAEPEDRSDPRRSEEEWVSTFILGASKNPKAVEFIRWGPHMPGTELMALFRDRAIDQLRPTMYQKMQTGSVYIVRVCFKDPNDCGIFAPLEPLFVQAPREPSHVHDRLYIVFNKQARPLQDNFAGDQWTQDVQHHLTGLIWRIEGFHLLDR